MTGWDARVHHGERLKSHLVDAPWILRVTEWSDRPPPLYVIKERVGVNGAADDLETGDEGILTERGRLYGEPQRRCLSILKRILKEVRDPAGVPLELERYLSASADDFRGNLPLSEEAGAKCALIFKLRERVDDLDRVELIARRVERFTREEACYWHSRIVHFGEAPSRWALAGMRTMLGGQPGDPAVEEMLEHLRRKGKA